ncbi:hypothetical protein LguiA_025740 [Lonicera macranthoides]
MDQVTPRIYMPIVFYYPNHAPSSLKDIADKSSQLKSSLFEILTHYYPFAGRLNCGAYVDCNDKGVEFQEANIKCGLSEILEKPQNEVVDLVFPSGLAWGKTENGSSLLVIRLTNFECGGMSIAVCLSHGVADAQNFSTFMISWANKMRTNSSSKDSLLSPHFISYPLNDDVVITPEWPHPKKRKVTRRFVFPNSKLTLMKAMADERLPNTTRVEVLTALLYKCAVATTTTNSGSFIPSVLFQLVNMRPKMLPPLPETSTGNLSWPIIIPTRNESENNFNTLVRKIKKGKMEIEGMKNFDATKHLSINHEYARNNYSFFVCSSLCRMKFYQIDFGWGYPSRVNLADTPINNCFLLMDTPYGDGIEALVSLEEQGMVSFELDKSTIDPCFYFVVFMLSIVF